MAGRWTLKFLRDLRFDTAFVSAAGITVEAGLTTSRGALADVFNAARAAANRTVALLDASKFGRASLVPIVAARELDLIVTDDGLDPRTGAAFRAAGVPLRVAGYSP